MGAELAAHFQFWAFNSIQSQARTSQLDIPS